VAGMEPGKHWREGEKSGHAQSIIYCRPQKCENDVVHAPGCDQMHWRVMWKGCARVVQRMCKPMVTKKAEKERIVNAESVNNLGSQI
jgi:hypothetical protein